MSGPARTGSPNPAAYIVDLGLCVPIPGQCVDPYPDQVPLLGVVRAYAQRLNYVLGPE